MESAATRKTSQPPELIADPSSADSISNSIALLLKTFESRVETMIHGVTLCLKEKSALAAKRSPDNATDTTRLISSNPEMIDNTNSETD